MGKVIHWELCKKFKFDHMNKWHMHNPASVLENETCKLLWDFDIQTDHLISAIRLDLIIVNKRERESTCRIVDFAVPADHRVKLKDSEKKDKYLDLAWELKKTMEHESDVYTNCNWRSCYSHQRINKGTGGLGNQRKREGQPNHCIIEINQNIEKSSGDLRKLAVNQTSVKDHQLMLM